MEKELAFYFENQGFFLIHETDGGYDYTFYDENYNLIDGGVYENSRDSIADAAMRITGSYLWEIEYAEEVDYDTISEICEEAEQEKLTKAIFEETEDELEAERNREPEIRVVYVEPGEEAKEMMIKNTLESLQEHVGGGLIETYYPFSEDVCIVCNDEGKFNGMELNRAIYAEGTREMMDIIAGPFFICDCSGEYFKSLNDEQVERYKKQFLYPEHFIKFSDEIIAVKYMKIEEEPEETDTEDIDSPEEEQEESQENKNTNGSVKL